MKALVNSKILSLVMIVMFVVSFNSGELIQIFSIKDHIGTFDSEIENNTIKQIKLGLLFSYSPMGYRWNIN